MSGLEGKPFAIPKQLVWQAWKSVKANGGAAGADGVTIEMFERDLAGNLYKIWNRMSSGTYFPPPVRAAEIPKSSGGTRLRIHRRTATELQDLAAWINPIVRGWVTYYGRYYKTALDRLLRRINTYLMRWAQQKYRRLRPFRKARRWWQELTARQPHLFAHWAWENEFSYSYG